jgi:hypothetical protein
MFARETIVVALICMFGRGTAAKEHFGYASYIPDAKSLVKRGGSGDTTYFKPGLGACGEQSQENDLVVAMVRGLLTMSLKLRLTVPTRTLWTGGQSSRVRCAVNA